MSDVIRCALYPNCKTVCFYFYQRNLDKTTQFSISVRGPLLWNNRLLKNKKEIYSFLPFKQCAEEKVMELRTAANFFQ